MVNLGKLAKRAKNLADKQGDKIAGAVDKATDAVDKKTKGKYSEKLDKVDQLAKKLDKTAKSDPTADEAGDEPGTADGNPSA
jgi:hypothetical protein